MRTWKEITPRERILSLLIAAVIGVGGLYVYALEPLAGAWSDVRSEANSTSVELSELRNLVANRDSIEKNFQDFADAMMVGSSEEKLQVDLLGEVGKVAAGSGLQVSSIKPLQARSAGRLDRLSVQLNAVCAAHEFVDFLRTIQEPAHLLRAEDIDVVVGRRRPPLTVTLTLTKLVRIEPSAQQPKGH